MSSEQISEKPLSPDKNRCPHCGGIKAPPDEMCQRCRNQVSIQEGPAPYHAVNASVPGSEGAAPRENPAWMYFGGLAILLCGALAFAAPGFLILLLILATPALIHTADIYSRPADSRNNVTLVGTFLGAIGVATLVGLASFAAFFATCFVVYGGTSMSNRYSDEILSITVGIFAGLGSGLTVAVLLFRYFWIRKG